MKKLLIITLLFLTILPSLGYASKLEFDHREIFFDYACTYYKMYYEEDLSKWDKAKDTFKLKKTTNLIGKITKGDFEWMYNNTWIDDKTAKKKTQSELIYNESINKTGYTNVRYCANIERKETSEGWTVLVDHIPEFEGKDYPEYDWWSNTYGYRKEITFSDLGGFNLTNAYSGVYIFNHEGHATPTVLNDLVVTDLNNNVIKFNTSVFNSTHALIRQQYNITANSNASYYAYFGNTTGVGSQSQALDLDVRNFGDSDYDQDEDGNVNEWNIVHNDGGGSSFASGASPRPGSEGSRNPAIQSGVNGYIAARTDSTTLSEQAPKHIELWLKIDNYNGYGNFTFLNTTNHTLFGFVWGDGNNIYWLDDDGNPYNDPMNAAVANNYYNLTISDIDWTACTADVWTDGVQDYNDINFFDCYNGFKTVHISQERRPANVIYRHDDAFGIQNFDLTFGDLEFPPGIRINVTDEKDYSTIGCYNLTISNTSESQSWTCQNNTFFANETQTPLGDITVTISKNGYTTRTYYETITTTGAFLYAYLLKDSDASLSRFHVHDESDRGVYNALVVIEKSIGGTYTVVGEGRADSSGTVSMALDPTVTYRVTASLGGYTTTTAFINPTSSDYTIYITSLGETTGLNFTSTFDDLFYEFYPAYPLINSTSNQTFYFYVNATNSTLQYWGFNLTHWNSTHNDSSLCLKNSSSSGGGYLYCYVDLRGMEGNISMDAFIKKTGYGEWTQSFVFFIHGVSQYNNTIYGVLNDAESVFEIPQLALAILSLLFSLIGAAMTTTTFDREGGAIGGLLILGGFTFVLNWFNFYIYIFVCVVVLALLYLSWRSGGN